MKDRTNRRPKQPQYSGHEKEQMPKSFLESQAYNHILFAGSPIPLVVIDSEISEYVEINQAAMRIYGVEGLYQREDLVGKKILSFSTPTQYDGSDSGEAAQKHIQLCLKNGFEQFEWRHQKPDGTLWDAEVTLSAIQVQGKSLILYSLQDITERKRAEQALRDNEEKYHRLFEAESDAIFLIENSTGQILEANIAASNLYGYSNHEWVGLKNVDISAEPQKTLQSTIEQVRSIPVRWHRKKNGTIFPVEINTTHMTLQGRSVQIAAIRDISERVQREKEIREKAQDYQIIFDTVPMMIWFMDGNGFVLRANKTASDIMGIPAEKQVGMSHYDLFSREEADHFLADNREVIQSRRPKLGIVETYVDRKGQKHWVQTDKIPYLDDKGLALGVFIFVNDITDRKNAEETLRVSEERYRMLVEQAPEAILVYDVDLAKIVDANPVAEKLFGYNHAVLCSQDVTPFYADAQPDGRQLSESMQEHITRALAGEVLAFERTVLSAGSIPILCEERLVRLPSTGHRLLRASYVDISERKKAEKTLKNSQHMLQTVLNTFPGEVFWKDRQSVFLGSNTAFATARGLEPGQVVGRTEFDFPSKHKKAEAFVAEDARVMESGAPLAGVIESFEDIHQQVIWFDKIKVPIFNDEGSVIGVLGVSHDITQRVNAESEIRALNATLEQRVEERSRQLESANKELSAFSYLIAHDLRQPLRALDGFSHLLLDEYNEKLDEDGKNHLARVRNASHRMGQLIDDLLKLLQVTRREFNLSEVHLGRLGRNSIHGKRTLYPERKFKFICSSSLVVKADPGMMEIVIDALVDNAWKFTYQSNDPLIELGCSEQDGQVVYFVRDNGIGIDMTYKEKLFTPFERLLPPGQVVQLEGTGIGLAMAQRIIQRHGGRIWAESTLGAGTTINFTLG